MLSTVRTALIKMYVSIRDSSLSDVSDAPPSEVSQVTSLKRDLLLDKHQPQDLRIYVVKLRRKSQQREAAM
jgi:hypothetical protein